MNHCIFCNIVKKTTETKIIDETDDLLVFDDLNPQAPIHHLIIPKQHIATLNDLKEDDTILAGKMILMAKNLANKYHIAEEGYRLNFNCNSNGGQTVYHIHLHFLAGRKFSWPPG